MVVNLHHIIKNLGNYINVFYEVNLLVIRIDKKGNYVSSKCCDCCIKFMNSISSHIKIKNIYYFDENGKFCCEKLKNMKTDHVSVGFRKIKC